jgi:adenosylmethionine-8-amino-7-oxononanoate aminotransferase
MNPVAKLDHQFVWHPFTQMRDWLKREPIVLVEAQGAVMRDIHGRQYLDANSSIWTNLHGHRHPGIDAALRAQLDKIAHSSALGLANEPASRLARELVRAANPRSIANSSHSHSPAPEVTDPATLSKVFFSDDGSTAMEVALKLAYEYARRSGMGSPGGPAGKDLHTAWKKKDRVTLRRLLQRGPKFLSLEGAYHGDTIGAVSLGHIDLFHQSYSNLLFETDKVMAPYCYRCPYNQAKPDRDDSRTYRKCNWECLDKVEQRFKAQKRKANSYAAFVFEPLIQGAAGMIPQPEGWLRRAAQIARDYGALLIADEVMTGFGRTGGRGAPENVNPRQRMESERTSGRLPPSSIIFASHQEQVQPDLLAVAKGLTGGYLPMAATLTSQAVFDAFLGEYEEFKTFFHGHSFTGNQLGAAAALASLEILQSPASIRSRRLLETALRYELKELWHHPTVGDIRQVGLVAGIELVKNWRTRESFDLREQAGIRVCEAMARRGVLTRPIGNVIVLMPPYCTTTVQLRSMVSALREAIENELER